MSKDLLPIATIIVLLLGGAGITAAFQYKALPWQESAAEREARHAADNLDRCLEMNAVLGREYCDRPKIELLRHQAGL